MKYIFDIILNLHEEFINFFEWEKKDKLLYVKKLPIFCIDNGIFHNIIFNSIKVSKSFLEMINYENYSSNLENDKYRYMCLLTNKNTVIGVCFDEDGRNILVSDLLIDDQEEILEEIKDNPIIMFDYDLISKKEEEKFLTRKEINLKKVISREITNLYKNNDLSKLAYFYYEYFNIESDDIKLMYNNLISSLENEIDEKHFKIYEILKLSKTKI